MFTVAIARSPEPPVSRAAASHIHAMCPFRSFSWFSVELKRGAVAKMPSLWRSCCVCRTKLCTSRLAMMSTSTQTMACFECEQSAPSPLRKRIFMYWKELVFDCSCAAVELFVMTGLIWSGCSRKVCPHTPATEQPRVN